MPINKDELAQAFKNNTLYDFYVTKNELEKEEIFNALPGEVARILSVDPKVDSMKQIILFLLRSTNEAYRSDQYLFVCKQGDNEWSQLVVLLLCYQSEKPEKISGEKAVVLQILSALLSYVRINLALDLNGVKNYTGQNLLLMAIDNYPEAFDLLIKNEMNVNGAESGSENAPPGLYAHRANLQMKPCNRMNCLPVSISLDVIEPILAAIMIYHKKKYAGKDTRVYYDLILKIRNHASFEFMSGPCMTPLMFAAYLGELELVKFLSYFGEDITREDLHGNNALAYAMQAEQNDTVLFLLMQGYCLKNEENLMQNQDYSKEIKDEYIRVRNEYKNVMPRWFKVDLIFPSQIAWMTLEGYYLTENKMPAGKDCLYDAIVPYYPDKTVESLRSEVAELIDQDTFKIHEGEGAFEGEIEIKALVHLLRRTIIVFHETTDAPTKYLSPVHDEQLPPIFIKHNGENLFCNLQPKPGYTLQDIYERFLCIETLKMLPYELKTEINQFCPIPLSYVDQRYLPPLENSSSENPHSFFSVSTSSIVVPLQEEENEENEEDRKRRRLNPPPLY